MACASGNGRHGDQGLVREPQADTTPGRSLLGFEAEARIPAMAGPVVAGAIPLTVSALGYVGLVTPLWLDLV